MRPKVTVTCALLAAAALFAIAISGAAQGSFVGQVRAAASAGNFARAQQLVDAYRQARGVTPELILGVSWIARGAQASGVWDVAEKYAAEARRLALEELKKRPLDADEDLPLALGASIEVHAHRLAARNARAEAVAFLERELKQWRATSMRTRIQKNLHLLSLAGKPAPPLDTKEYVGAAPQTLEQLKGRPVILFFWAHWCGDCKQQKTALEQLLQEHGANGLVVMGPTQRYGYAARGEDATPAEELRYIAAMRESFYGTLPMGVPVSEENFKAWGASTTPTLAVIDRKGIVRLYHAGRLPHEKLAPVVAEVVREK